MNFIDNVLRGGLPVNLAVGTPPPLVPSIDTVSLTEYIPPNALTKENPKIFHAFSRIHGDLERDYNNFQLEPTFFSQGPGNFRDVAQNRRSDVLQVALFRSLLIQIVA